MRRLEVLAERDASLDADLRALIGRLCRKTRAATPGAGLVTRAAQAGLVRAYWRLEVGDADLVTTVRALDGIVRAAKALRVLDLDGGRWPGPRRRAVPVAGRRQAQDEDDELEQGDEQDDVA